MTILLTATIDTNNCIDVARTSIEERTNDYYNTISRLLSETDLEIVFVENSNYDLGKISEFKNNDRVEILQFSGNSYNRIFGRSFGEQMIINYALLNSQKLKSVDYIMKLTGRYYVNIKLFERYLNWNYLFYCKKRDNLKNWIFTGFFKMPKSFWIKHILPTPMFETKTTFEELMWSKIKQVDPVVYYLSSIGLEGVSGTDNVDINTGLHFITDKPIVLRTGNYKTGLVNLTKSLSGDTMTMIEIGSYTGESTKIFIDSGKFNKIYCVDSWTDDVNTWYLSNCSFEIIEQYFDNNIMSNYSDIVTKFKNYSYLVSDQFENESIDFIYIDGSHDYQIVKQDITMYLPKVKNGGYIAGHDYINSFPDVIKAVNEIFGKDNIKKFEDSSWIIQVNR